MTSKASFQRLMTLPAAASLLAVILTACGTDSPGGNLGAGPTGQSPTNNVDVPSDELPAGFPVDDVPLVDGQIVSAGGTVEEGIWIVVIRSTDSPEAARTRAIALLTAAGYAEPEGLEGTGIYTNGVHKVIVRSGQQSGGTIVNYSISTE